MLPRLPTKKPALEATRADVQAWIRYLSRRGLKPLTIRRKASALSLFLAYAVEEGAVASNPAAHTRRPSGDTSQRLSLSDPDAAKLITAASDLGPRALALVLQLITSGLRVSEACNLAVGDIDQDAGHPVVRVRRQGGCTGRIPLATATYIGLVDIVDGGDTSPVFVGPRGVKFAREAAATLISEVGEAAGVANVHPHLVRHTAAAPPCGLAPTSAKSRNCSATRASKPRCDMSVGLNCPGAHQLTSMPSAWSHQPNEVNRMLRHLGVSEMGSHLGGTPSESGCVGLLLVDRCRDLALEVV